MVDNSMVENPLGNQSVKLINFHNSELFHDFNNASVSHSVTLQDVYFRYKQSKKRGETTILNGVHMAVPHGKIYALLGSSGSGKTTLLRCILGSLKIAYGYVEVLGAQPGDRGSPIPGPGVGYMPQELSLFPDFTVEDTLRFFGKLYDVAESEISSRSDFILKLLNLNCPKKVVSQLSGGMKRRLSLAVALIHKPPLLILDEPTVGVDPLLRDSIWKHLINLSRKENVTIIITTHYIEEARGADVVAFLRNGKVLVEDNPLKLMQEYKLPTLEAVFTKICKIDESPRLVRQMSNSHFKSRPSKTVRTTHISPVISRRKVAVLVRKNLGQFFRNFFSILIKLTIPATQMGIIAVAFGSHALNSLIPVYNEEIEVDYSSKFLSYIPPERMILKNVNSLEEAIGFIRRGEAPAALAFAANYSDSLYERRNYPDLDVETIQNSEIRLFRDMTNKPIADSILITVVEAYLQFADELAIEEGKDPIRNRVPLAFKNWDPKFQPTVNYLAQGLVLISYFAMCGLTSTTIVAEKRLGIFERTLVAGVTVNEFIISHIIIQLVVLSCQLLFIYLTFILGRIVNNGSFIYTMSLLFVHGCDGIAYGLFLAAISSSEVSAVMLLFGTFFPVVFISGMMWPLDTMPKLAQYIGYLTPITFPSKALEEILYRGQLGFDHYLLPLGFLSAGAWTAFLCVASLIIFKHRQS